MKTPNVVFNGIGSYVPDKIIPNAHFLNHEFYMENGQPFDISNEEIIRKFEKITGIKERRYANDDQLNSDLGYLAAVNALENSSIDKEELDYIIYAQNFGDMKAGSNRVDNMPSLAAKVKHKLKIKNPDVVCYDIIFGCPGWVQGVIQAFQMIRSGFCRNVMVIGAETLSRVVDPHDRDGMIFSDGSGATIVSASYDDDRKGILGFANRTDADEELNYLAMAKSNKPGLDESAQYIKMKGRKIYEYALEEVATAMQSALRRSGIFMENIQKVLIHQANEKMDEAILRKLGQLYNLKLEPENMMPMTIQKFGNNSVATVPVMLDMILKGKIEGHHLKEGDDIILASVGAGMHINAIIYRM
ncbi:3-oxoacyl-ACP synthase III family protein [Marivirga sp.]|uniref:3-oxoacyl-ACP synthase III family protein n=1 Tax=Marivirga sp. TaxID=2018662 RepID=UPI002D809F14|nr:3-oxoacyl-ACP synthase III family protein [Marivirga sp.]HET8860420.1 3-oxoacyl-ACP synthase III family protein [Marivirga sp.]